MENPQALTWLVVNQASGSNDDAAVTRLVEAMDAAGFPPQRVVAIPHDDIPDRAELDEAGVGLLAAFTGDGTVNAVVTRLYGWGGEVLVLPGGTQNLLARACHGDCPAEAIVERLGQGKLRPARRPLIRCAHGDGLCEIVAGPGATWSEVREAIRDADIGGVAASVREALDQTTAGPRVTLADPALGKPEGYKAVRIHPSDGALAIDGYAAEGLGEYAQQGMALLRRDYREGPHDDLGRHREVLCRSAAPIELMIDGERVTGAMEERFALGECDVTFLVGPE